MRKGNFDMVSASSTQLDRPAHEYYSDTRFMMQSLPVEMETPQFNQER